MINDSVDIEEKAESGDVDCQFQLAEHLRFTDVKQALYWYEKAAQSGHAEAAYNAAALLMKIANKLTDKDRIEIVKKKSIHYYKYAANNGNEQAKKALTKLGFPYFYKPKNIDKKNCLSEQKSLWFHDQLVDEGVYNLSISLNIKGDLNLTILKSCFSKLIKNHESLRVSFRNDSGEITQTILDADEIAFNLKYEDFSLFSSELFNKKFIEYSNQYLGAKFDLAKAPLFKAVLIKKSDYQYKLVICMHHIISDQQSLYVIEKDIVNLYNQEIQGIHAEDIGIIQYSDYIGWRKDYLNGSAYNQQLSFWHDHLNGVPHVSTLPSDRDRPNTLSYRGGYIRHELSPQISESLKHIAEKSQSSLYMIFLSALFVVLHRFTSQTKLLIATPASTRFDKLLDNIIGYFVNPILLKLDIDNHSSFDAILKYVKGELFAAFENKDVPFDKIVDALKVSRSLNMSPLAQIMFNYRYENTPPEMIGVSLTREQPIYNYSKYDLTVSVEETSSGLALEFEYAKDLYNEITIQEMALIYEKLLDDLNALFNVPVTQLSLLDKMSKDAIIANNIKSYKHFHITGTIHQEFEAIANKYPNKIALSFSGEELTYNELNNRANQLAHYLRSHNVGLNHLVGVCTPRGFETIISIIAVLKTGAAYIPIDPSYPKARIQYILDNSEIKFFLTLSSLDTADFFKEKSVCFIDKEWKSQIETFSTENLNLIVKVNQLAYVIFTSGSTGKPKGVMVEHRQVVRLFKATQGLFNFTENDVWTLFHSCSFDFSVWEMWGALLFGGRLCIIDEKTSKNVELFFELFQRESVTILNQTPPAFYALQTAIKLLPEAASKEHSLRYVIFGGDALNVKQLDYWIDTYGFDKPELINMYGITETTVHATFKKIISKDDKTIGQALSDLMLYVVDERNDLVPNNVVGELIIAGSGVTRGYLNNDALTKQRFIKNVAFENQLPDRYKGMTYYKTGDLVKRDIAGELVYIGRIDHQVKIRGFRIDLSEIELCLRSFESIENAVVLVKEINNLNELVAYIQLKDDQDNAEKIKSLMKNLKNYTKSYLPKYMLPSRYVIVDLIPLTENGKIDKTSLLQIKDTQSHESDYDPPRTKMESIIADIWKEVLSVERVGCYDDYFELGGDSIKCIRVIALARLQGINLTIESIFNNPILANLALQVKKIDSEENEIYKPFDLISDEDKIIVIKQSDHIIDAYPLTDLQSGMLFHSQRGLEKTIYQDTFSFIIPLPFSQKYFNNALNILFKNNSVLRTSFVLDLHHHPMQYVYDNITPPLKVSHWGIEDPDLINIRIDEWIADEKMIPIQINKAPLIRFAVHTLRGDNFHLGFTMHHAILDGWSVASMITLLLKQYSHSINNNSEVPIKKPLKLKFAEYVKKEIEFNKSLVQKEFWKKYLSDFSFLMLPNVSIKDQWSTSDIYQCKLDEKINTKIEDLSKKIRIPTKTIFLSAFLRLLSVLSNLQDILIGLTLNCRLDKSGGDEVLGLFINTLPFRVKMNHKSWKSLLVNSWETEKSIIPYRHSTLNNIQAYNDKKSLFNVAFNYIDFHIYNEIRESNIEISSEKLYEETNFCMGLNIIRSDNCSSVQFAFDGDIFEIDEIKAYFQYYENILIQMLTDIDADYHQQCILDDETYNKLVYTYNKTECKPMYKNNIIVNFEAIVEKFPDRIALIHKKQTLTYKNLNHKANQLARYIIQGNYLPISNDSISPNIVIFLDKSNNSIISILAVLKINAVYVPIDPEYPEARIRHILSDVEPVLVVTQSCYQSIFKKYNCLVIDRLDELTEGLSTNNIEPQLQKSQLLYLVYTSGSTGMPKGVMVTHQNLLNSIHARQEFYKKFPLKALLLLQSISVDTANLSIFWALISGASLVIINKDDYLDVKNLVSSIKINNISHMLLTPSLYNSILLYITQNNIEVSHNLKCIVLGGESFDFSLIQQHKNVFTNTNLYNEYGPTEATVWCCGNLVYDADTKKAQHEISVGRPILNTQIYILDQSRQPVPPNVLGELYIGGSGVSKGYYKRKNETKDKFIVNKFFKNDLESSNVLYRTGDLALWSYDGNIIIKGRIDTQVKIRGFRVELTEVEYYIKQCAKVINAIVITKTLNNFNNMLVAYVKFENTNIDNGELLQKIKQHLTNNLPNHMIPSVIMPIDDFPINVNGKIELNKLPLPNLSVRKESTKCRVPPRTDTERSIIKILAELLNLNKSDISPNDNFFNIGGDSIISIQLTARLQANDIFLTVKDIFDYPIIADMALLVESSSVKKNANYERYGHINLLPIQHWFFENKFNNINHFNQSYLLELNIKVSSKDICQSFIRLFETHEILKSKFEITGHEYLQKIEDKSKIQNDFFNYFDFSNEVESTLNNLITKKCNSLQEALNIEKGQLVKVALFECPEGQAQKLFITIHHLVVDGVSWRVLLSDLEYYYQHIQMNDIDSRLEKPLPVKYWSELLTTYSESTQMHNEIEFWVDVINVGKKCNFIKSGKKSLNASEFQYNSILDSKNTSDLLYNCNRALNTKIEHLLLSALYLSFRDVFGKNVFYSFLEGHGRENLNLEKNIDLNRTVAWFTSMYPVAITFPEKLEASYNLIDVIALIKEQLNKIPNKGLGYGLLRYLSKSDKNTIKRIKKSEEPLISFNYLGQLDNSVNTELFTLSDIDCGLPIAHNNPIPLALNIHSFIANAKLNVQWNFDGQLSHEIMQKYSEQFIKRLKEIINLCKNKCNLRSTPSDYPLVNVDQKQLDIFHKENSDIKEILPLSPMQKGMLLHSMQWPDSDNYILQLVYELQGFVDLEKFKTAWDIVINHHDALKASFLIDNVNEPLQIISSQVNVKWQYYDWKDVPSERYSQELHKLMKDERRKSFDITKAPLLRFQCISISDDVHFHILNKHHILSDGWSLPLILSDVIDTYKQILKNPEKEPVLKPSYHYTDYFKWLRNCDDEKAKLFWRDYLKGYTSLSYFSENYSFNHSRENSQKGCFKISFNPEERSFIKSFCNEHALTMSTLLESALAILMAFYLQQSEIIFGITVSGRANAISNVDKMVGLFINTLPLRVNVNPEQDVISLIKETQNQVSKLDSYNHVSLATIQAESEIAAGQSLFDTLFVFENYPVDHKLDSEKSEFSIRLLDNHESVEYPLALFIAEANEILCEWSYETNVFSEQFIFNLAKHYKNLIISMISNKMRKVSDLSILSDYETSYILSLNSNKATFPKGNLYDLFNKQAMKYLNNTAILDQGVSYSYKELLLKINHVESYLLRSGVKANMIVAIAMNRSIEAVVTMLALIKLGASFLPINPDLPMSRQEYMLYDSKSSSIVTISKYIANYDGFDLNVIDYQENNVPYKTVIDDHPPSYSLNQLAYIIYTSGSTGNPKGVMVEHHSVVNCIFAVRKVIDFTSEDRFLALTSLSFDVSILDYFLPLSVGASVVISHDDVIKTPDDIVNDIEQYNVTAIQATPTMWKVICNSNWSGRDNFKIMSAGEALTNELSAKLCDKGIVYNLYGPTEATIYSTIKHVSHPNDVNIGKPISNVQAYILNDDLNVVPIGVKGELYLAGAGIAKGYVNNDLLTKEKFIENPNEKNVKLYRTGDIVKYSLEGEIIYLGRKDEQVKIYGHRIELQEIEIVVLQHPYVQQAAAFIKKLNESEHLILALSFKDVQKSHKELHTEIYDYLKEVLPKYMMPNHLLILDLLPINSNGKIDKRSLYNIDVEVKDKKYIKPKSKAEEILCDIWRNVLGVKNVSVIDNFFHIGGDSIKSIDVVFQAKRKGINISPKDIFVYENIRKICQYYSSKLDSAPIKKARSISSKPYAFSPIQQWFFEQNYPSINHFNQSHLIITNEKLDLDRLKNAFIKLLRHHAMLHSTIIKHNDNFRQTESETVNNINIHLIMRDNPKLLEILQKCESSHNIYKNSFLSAVILRDNSKLNDQIFLSVHHFVIDTISWRVLIEDLFSLYKGENLPHKTTTYREWCNALAEYSIQLCHKKYWRTLDEIASRQNFLQIPHDAKIRIDQFENKTIQFDEEFVNKLETCNYAFNTQINDILLSAFAISLQSINKTNDIVFMLEGHGREDSIADDIDLSRSIGWFTTKFPVLLSLKNLESLREVIISVKEQIRAIPDKGLSYGVLKYINNINFKNKNEQIVFNYLGNYNKLSARPNSWGLSDEKVGQPNALNNTTHSILELNGIILNNKLRFYISYAKSYISDENINIFSNTFKSNLMKIVSFCSEQKHSIKTPSDLLLQYKTKNMPRVLRFNEENANRAIIWLPPGHGGSESYIQFLKNLKQDIASILIENVEYYSEEMFNSLESLSSFYVDIIQQLKLEVPIALAGWSFGGVLAHEIAVQLSEQKIPISNLYLIDPYLWTSKYRNNKLDQLNRQKIDNPLCPYSKRWLGDYRYASYIPKVYNAPCDIFTCTQSVDSNLDDDIFNGLVEHYIKNQNLLNGYRPYLTNVRHHKLTSTHNDVLTQNSKDVILALLSCS